MTEVGYVTMRNEDGTQYAAIMFGGHPVGRSQARRLEDFA